MAFDTLICEDSYVADGTANPRDIGFPIADPAYLVIEVDGVVQTLGADYLVDGDFSGVTGRILPQAPWASGATVRYYRNTVLRQAAELPAGRPLPSRRLEAQLDRDVMRIQELDVDLGRALKIPRGETAPTLPDAADRAGKWLGFNVDGDPVASPGAPQPGEGYVDYPFSLTEGASQIVEPAIVGLPIALILNGVELSEGVDYTRSGATITLAVPGHDGDGGVIRVQKAALLLQASAENVSWRRPGLTAAQYRALASKAADRFDFRDMLGADLGGANDMASTMATALASAKSSGDILHVPKGVIALASTVPISSGVRIAGVGCRPYTSLANGGSRGDGSWFHIAHGGVGFAIADGASWPTGIVLERFGTFRTQPAVAPGWAPNDHDFDITSNGARALLRDLVLLNPTRAIRQLGGGAAHLSLDRVCGQPFEIGVLIDSGYEGFTVNGLRWWPFWSNDLHTRAYTLANRRGMYLRHIDNPYVNGFFDFGSHYPLALGSHENGVVNNANFVNPEFDNFGGIAVFVQEGSDGSDIKMTSGYCWGHDETGSAIECYADNVHIHTIGFSFENLQRRAALLEGTGNRLTVIDPVVKGWNIANGGFEAFAADNGNAIHIEGEIRRSGGNGAALINNASLVASSEIVTVSPLSVSADTGTITTASASAEIQRSARWVRGTLSVTVTTNGTGAGSLHVGLPIPVAPGKTYYSMGRNVTTGQMVQCAFNASTCVILTPANGYPIASGETIDVQVDYGCEAP